MTVTEKQITVYVADDGSEHGTHELALQQNIRKRLGEILDKHAAYGEIQVSDAVDVIMREWGVLSCIMRGEDPPAPAKRSKRYRCSKCSATAPNEHHDECPNYGEGKDGRP